VDEPLVDVLAASGFVQPRGVAVGPVPHGPVAVERVEPEGFAVLEHRHLTHGQFGDDEPSCGGDGAGRGGPPAATHFVLEEVVDRVEGAAGAAPGQHQIGTDSALDKAIVAEARPVRFRDRGLDMGALADQDARSLAGFRRPDHRELRPRHLVEEAAQLLGRVALRRGAVIGHYDAVGCLAPISQHEWPGHGTGRHGHDHDDSKSGALRRQPRSPLSARPLHSAPHSECLPLPALRPAGLPLGGTMR